MALETANQTTVGQVETQTENVPSKRVRLDDTEAEPRSTTQQDRLVLQVKRHAETAQLPVRGSEGAAGYDLFASQEIVIPAKGKAIVPTDISIKLPVGTYGRVAPRSGLAVKHFLDVGAGVIDSDYTGLVGVVLFNFNDQDYKVSVGDRVAQLIVERIATPEVQEVEELGQTDRGAGGFGSTGK